MSLSTIVVRVQSSIGISRITLNKNGSLGDLKRELSKRIQIDGESNVKLVNDDTDAEIIGEDSDLLHSLNITHGTCLRLENSPIGPGGSIGVLRYVNVPDPNVDKNKEPSKEDDGDSKNPTTSSQAEPQQSKEPKFKSFDSWLKDNGYNLGELPLRQSYKRVIVEKGKMIKVPLGITIKHQPYRHVDHLEMMAVDNIQDFANYWMNDLEMEQRRAGWLYGYYVEDSHYPLGIRAVCEAIYEPPQVSDACDVKFLEDDFLQTVDTIAERLGLERIGHLFTHLPRDQYLSPQDIIDCAKIQLERARNCHYTGYPVSTHVTCTLHIGNDGKPCLNAFMVSDVAMVLLRDGLIDDQQPGLEVQVAKPRHKSELLPRIFVPGKETESIDPDWFVVRVNESAPIKKCSIFKHFDFPRMNRGKNQIGPVEVGKYFAQKLMSFTNSGYIDADPRH
ncbi:bifunctional Nuclear protein localization protein 4/Nuclear pore localization protein Npl4 [Babesia duncani]|uniref:Bifunctional Nuclear protein localization protein 4/Nuclear pore localization protein Npl4 n=1 Tax=Babesia duncani TaxID=323732 RepID=A0AAD9PIP8_9APIC|nr:bifunctional Nuclear protein localization protein 4/Nuclear pore localization protein Npl4 [Babesia duncani]